MMNKFFIKLSNIIEAVMFVAGVSVIGSCSSSPSKTEHINVKEMAFDEASKDFSLTSNFKNIKFVQLQATDECIIGDVKKVIDVGEEIVVLTNDNEIFCFKKEDGKYLRQIGNIGEGPEEYLQIGDIYYNDKAGSINVIDYLRGSIVTYGLDGTFVSRKKTDADLGEMVSAEYSSDGYLMVCNMLSDAIPPSEFAYTVIKPNDEFFGIDPFEPVKVKGYSTSFASRPMTIGDKGLTFLKFLNDTVFTMKEGQIAPLYKLSMKKKMPQKDVVAQMGSFGTDELFKMSLKGNYFSGFDKIFETEQYIVLVPMFYAQEGYFWIDKKTGKGIHVNSSNEFNLDVDMMLQGRSIIKIAGCNGNGIISCIPSEFVEVFRKELTEKKDLQPFDARLKPFFENADPEGNPCLVIYGN